MMDIVAFLAGYAFALVGGYFYVGAVVGLLWKLDPHPRPASSPGGSRLLGLVERALYVTVLIAGRGPFIVVWLAMKVATDWRLERYRGRPPRLAYNTFLIGTGLSLLFAIAGAAIVRWGLAEDVRQWWNSLYLAIGLLLGAEALRQILIHTLKSKPAPEVLGPAPAAEQAEPVNALFAEPPILAEGERGEESLEDAGEPMDGPFGKIDLTASLRAAGGDSQSAAPESPIAAPPGSSSGANEPIAGTVRPRRARRTPEEIEELNSAVVQHLRANPWQGVNEIASALGLESQELRRPLHVLLTNRKIRKRGQGRLTEYRTGVVRKRKTPNAKKKTAPRRQKR